MLMEEVAALIGVALAAGGRRTPPRAIFVRYADALSATVGASLDASSDDLARRLRALGVDVPQGLSHDATLDLACATLVTPGFDPTALTFLYYYPASQAALARLKPETPPVAARFEAFAGGIELANGFHELLDAAEQRRRFMGDMAIRRLRGQPVAPCDEDFLAALEAGLPDCAGVALGIDRLVALALGASGVDAALAFAHVR
jgi:lysyl-tRNA synthetase class 2